MTLPKRIPFSGQRSSLLRLKQRQPDRVLPQPALSLPKRLIYLRRVGQRAPHREQLLSGEDSSGDSGAVGRADGGELLCVGDTTWILFAFTGTHFSETLRV